VHPTIWWLVLAITVVGPAVAVRGAHLGRAALVAFAPALAATVATAVTLPTAWGHKASAPGDDFTNAGVLSFLAAVLLIGGIVGFALAVIVRVARRKRAHPGPFV
jgi:hypothetical protein